MREMELDLGPEKIKVSATFKASMELAEKVGDPLYIAREATLEAMMMEKGMPYTPKWMFNVKNIPVILHIGMQAAGSNKTLEQVQDMAFDAGFPDARTAAMEYVGLIVSPMPEEKVESSGSAEGN